MPNKNILLVSWFYYPSSSVGARRIFNLHKYLRAFGHRVSVLTADQRQYDDVDVALTAAAEGVHRIPARFHLRVPARKKGERFLEGVMRRAKFIAARQFASLLFPDPYAGWIKPAVARARRLGQSNRFDVVVSSAQPWSGFIAGDAIASALKLPHVMDYRDPWTAGGYAGRPEPNPVRSAQLETELLSRAARVVVTTPSAATLFAGKFGTDVAAKVVLVRNGFDPDIYDRLHPERESPGGHRFRLVHTGVYYASRRIDGLMHAVHELVRANELAPDDLEVVSYGGLHAEDRRLARELDVQAYFVERDFVPYEESLGALRQSSMSLLVIGPDHAAMIPAKFYDYLMVERPIFAIGPLRSEVRDIIEQQHSGMYADVGSTATIVENLRRAIDRFRAGNLTPCKAPSEFNVRDQIRKLSDVIDAL